MKDKIEKEKKGHQTSVKNQLNLSALLDYIIYFILHSIIFACMFFYVVADGWQLHNWHQWQKTHQYFP